MAARVWVCRILATARNAIVRLRAVSCCQVSTLAAYLPGRTNLNSAGIAQHLLHFLRVAAAGKRVQPEKSFLLLLEQLAVDEDDLAHPVGGPLHDLVERAIAGA